MPWGSVGTRANARVMNEMVPGAGMVGEIWVQIEPGRRLDRMALIGRSAGVCGEEMGLFPDFLGATLDKGLTVRYYIHLLLRRKTKQPRRREL